MHYVPISIDYSDLLDAFVFFRGDLSGERNHDDLAKKIGYAGSNWVDTFWRDEDATAYMYRYVSAPAGIHSVRSESLRHACRLLLEYARIVSLDRDAMTFKMPS